MKDELDDLLSKAFRDETDFRNDSTFTAEVMQKLPHQGIPTVTRVAILSLFTIISVSIPMFFSADGDFYTSAEETFTDGLITFQYYMNELVYLV